MSKKKKQNEDDDDDGLTDSGGANYDSINKRKSMTKGDIVVHLSKKLGTTKKLSTQFLEELVTLAHKEAKKDFTIPGLGKLTVGSRKKRKGRNPATGATVVVPAKKFVKFKVAKATQDAVFPKKK